MRRHHSGYRSQCPEAEIIDVTKLRGHDLEDDDENKKIVFGVYDVVEDEDENELTFRIVGTDEHNIDKG